MFRQAYAWIPVYFWSDWKDSKDRSENSIRFAFRFDIHFSNYIGAILFHNLSSSFMQFEYSIVAESLRFFGEELFNMIFYVDQRVKNWKELSEQHLTSVIFC